MNKFLNVSFAMLCGVSVLATSHAGFAIRFGEFEELDTEWNKSTRTLCKDIEELMKGRGNPEEKKDSLASTSILNHWQKILDFGDMEYELAVSYRDMNLPGYAEKISKWVYPTEGQERQSFFLQISTDPTSIQNAFNKKLLKFSKDPVEEPEIKRPTVKKEDKDWTIFRKSFEEALKDGDRQAAHGFLKEIYKLSQNEKAAGTWLDLSGDEVASLVTDFGDLDKSRSDDDIIGFLENTPIVKGSVIDLEQQWRDNCRLFEGAYLADSDTAQVALSELKELAKSVPAAKNWLESSNAVKRFIAQQVDRVVQPRRQSNAPVVSPAIDPQQQWVDNRHLFEANYLTNPDVAQIALNELKELAAKGVLAAKTWLEVSKEVRGFMSQQVGEEQPRRQPIPTNVGHAVVGPYEKVQSRRDYRDLHNQFQPIMDLLEPMVRNQQNADVHILDNFVAANQGNLIQIASTIFQDNGQLSLEQVKTSLKTFIDAHRDVLAAYNYGGRVFTRDEIFARIDQAYQADMTPALCSHVYELAMQLFNSGHRPPSFGVHRLFDAVVENLETKGGCFQGRRNRQFVALSSMLAYCGLNNKQR